MTALDPVREHTAENDAPIDFHLHERCGAIHRDDACPTPNHAMNEYLIPVTSSSLADLLAQAWSEGYEASDHEAYHFSTHGRTDNPYKETP